MALAWRAVYRGAGIVWLRHDWAFMMMLYEIKILYSRYEQHYNLYLLFPYNEIGDMMKW